jgi:hypothetical protein
VRKERKLKVNNNIKNITKINLPKSRTSFNDNGLNKHEIDEIITADNFCIKTKSKKNKEVDHRDDHLKN